MRDPLPPLRHGTLGESTISLVQLPIGSVAYLGNHRTVDERNGKDAGGEEGDGGVGWARKWTMDEDKYLVSAWIRASTYPNVVGTNKRQISFWRRVAANYMKYAPPGALPRTRKTCNMRWNRAAPLVSKWTGIVEEMLHSNQSGTSMEDIVSRAHDLYLQQTGKKFELEHWWRLLHGQPTWRSFCNQIEDGPSKRAKINDMGAHCDTSTPVSENSLTAEGVGALIQPIVRKVAKKKAKGKASNFVDLVANHLTTLAKVTVDETNLFCEFVKIQERKAVAAEEEVCLRDRAQTFKERQWEEKIIRMNTADMSSEDAAYYKRLQEEIRSRYRQPPPSNEQLTRDDSSSSSSFSSYGLSFILEESTDDTPLLEEFLDDETDTQ